MSVSKTGSTAFCVERLRQSSITLLTGYFKEILKSAISIISPDLNFSCGVTYINPLLNVL